MTRTGTRQNYMSRTAPVSYSQIQVNNTLNIKSVGKSSMNFNNKRFDYHDGKREIPDNHVRIDISGREGQYTVSHNGCENHYSDEMAAKKAADTLAHEMANAWLGTAYVTYLNGTAIRTCRKYYHDDSDIWARQPTHEDARLLWLSVIHRAVHDATSEKPTACTAKEMPIEQVRAQARYFLWGGSDF